MRITSKILLPCLITAVVSTLSGQELILPLPGNPHIKNAPAKTLVKKALSDTPMELPFFDDFSQTGHQPDASHWSGNDAYINQSYPINPPSYGVATLDAIDSTGGVYANATIDPVTFNADLLTSKRINLDYPPSDSIYLSFFYQPMGYGIEPASYDSLCVDFFRSADTTWHTVWTAEGDSVGPFRQAMIPVTDTAFLNEDFRFRFRNKASLPRNFDYLDKRGNVDHWHVDYVRLDRNRSASDTIYRDVALNSSIPSMLESYESIPWDHFGLASNELYFPYINLTYFNNDTAVRNVSRKVEITDLVFGENYQSGTTTAQDISPATSETAQVTTIYPFEYGRGDTAVFRIKGYLRTDEFDNKINDTITRKQVFRDYFAYDDGTAERAYGLRGQGTNNSYMAVRFESFIEDELGGVDIYFAQLKDSVNLDYYYRFIVWNDNDGVPGEIIYDDDADYSVFYSDEVNQFTRIQFREPVPVDDVFYVGLLQYDQYLLNIGLDLNKPPEGRQLYSLGGDWQVSRAPGTIMLRPWVSRYYSVSAKETPLLNSGEIILYPNPVSDYLHVRRPDQQADEKFFMEIIDFSGRRMKSFSQAGESVYVGDLIPGVYLVRILSGSKEITTKKIVISD